MVEFFMSKEKERIFRMKQFLVRHEMSSNKVGVDGVLIGAWCPIDHSPKKILDVGCGCGLISLMIAQRTDDSVIFGIDIEPASISEAKSNVAVSAWKDRIKICNLDFQKLLNLNSENSSYQMKHSGAEKVVGHETIGSGIITKEKKGEDNDEAIEESELKKMKFDLIVSNPPFFSSGVDSGESNRMLARHVGSLSPEIIVKNASGLLNDSGIISLITVASDAEKLIELSRKSGLLPYKAQFVKGKPDTSSKRVLLSFIKKSHNESSDIHSEFVKTKNKSHFEFAPDLIIEYQRGEYSMEYRRLCSPFYLAF